MNASNEFPSRCYGVIRKLGRKIIHLYYRLYCRRYGIDWGEDWYLIGRPIFHKAPGSEISAGKRLVLTSRSSGSSLGVNHPVVLTTHNPDSFIQIGDDVGISGASLCAREAITIGDRVLIGANVMIIDSDEHSLVPQNRRYSQRNIQAASIRIEDDVFIGAGAIILKGVTVGRSSVVGAGSVVTRDVPPLTVVAGNPAKVVRGL